jgi:hypothetical protein
MIPSYSTQSLVVPYDVCTCLHQSAAKAIYTSSVACSRVKAFRMLGIHVALRCMYMPVLLSLLGGCINVALIITHDFTELTACHNRMTSCGSQRREVSTEPSMVRSLVRGAELAHRSFLLPQLFHVVNRNGAVAAVADKSALDTDALHMSS